LPVAGNSNKDCGLVNAPFVGGLWIEKGAKTPLLVVEVDFHGNDECWEPRAVWRLLRLDDSGGQLLGGTWDKKEAISANDAGMKRYRARQWAAAASDFRNSIAHDPGHVQAHYNLACVASLQHQKGAALAELRWLATSNDPEAAVKLGKGKTDPDLAFIAADPEGQKLLQGGH
jgi:hypothetical protein